MRARSGLCNPASEARQARDTRQMAQRDHADTARLSRGKAAAFDTKRDTGQGHESGKIGFSLAGENEDPGKRKNEKKKEKKRGQPSERIVAREAYPRDKECIFRERRIIRRAIYL